MSTMMYDKNNEINLDKEASASISVKANPLNSLRKHQGAKNKLSKTHSQLEDNLKLQKVRIFKQNRLLAAEINAQKQLVQMKTNESLEYQKDLFELKCCLNELQKRNKTLLETIKTSNELFSPLLGTLSSHNSSNLQSSSNPNEAAFLSPVNMRLERLSKIQQLGGEHSNSNFELQDCETIQNNEHQNIDIIEKVVEQDDKSISDDHNKNLDDNQTQELEESKNDSSSNKTNNFDLISNKKSDKRPRVSFNETIEKHFLVYEDINLTSKRVYNEQLERKPLVDTSLNVEDANIALRQTNTNNKKTQQTEIVLSETDEETVLGIYNSRHIQGEDNRPIVSNQVSNKKKAEEFGFLKSPCRRVSSGKENSLHEKFNSESKINW